MVWFRALGFEEYPPIPVRNGDECPYCKGHGAEENCAGGQSPCYVCRGSGYVDLTDEEMVKRLDDVNHYEGALTEEVIDTIDSLLTGYETALENILYKNNNPKADLDRITQAKQALEQHREESGLN